MKSKLERVRELRESGMSLDEAKRLVARQDLDFEIARARSIEDIRAILFSMNAR